MVCVFAGWIVYASTKSYDNKRDRIYIKFRKRLSKNGYRFIKHIPLTVRRVDSEFLLAFNMNEEICVFVIVYEKRTNLSSMSYVLDKFSKEGNFAEKIIYIDYNKKKIDPKYNEEIEKYDVQVWDKNTRIRRKKVNKINPKKVIDIKEIDYDDIIKRL